MTLKEESEQFKTNIINKAKMIGEILHSNQSYGEDDYIKHLDDVYNVLIRYGVTDGNLLASAYLHDTVEDCQMKIKLIEKYFNQDIAELVECVTNEIGKNRKERNLKTYEKLRRNKRAVVLKLADRIANVENCIRTKSKKFEMYFKEHQVFEYTLHDLDLRDTRLDLFLILEYMWNHLNILILAQTL